MKWKRALVALAVVVPLLVVLGLGFSYDPHEVPSVLQGRPAPSFALRTLDGQSTVQLSDLLGTPTLINFWSTWCVPCVAEHDLLQQAALELRDRVQFIGIVYQDTESAATRYLATRASHFPQLVDPGSRVAIDFGVAGVPESFVLDAEGRIVHKQVGVMTEEALAAVLHPLATRSQATDLRPEAALPSPGLEGRAP